MTRHLLQIIIFTVWIIRRNGYYFSTGRRFVRRIFLILQNTQHHPNSLHYPIHDRRGDQLSNFDPNPFNLKNPSNLKDSIEYDPKTNLYFLMEKIGNKYYRTPTAYTYEEYMTAFSQTVGRELFQAAGRYAE